uniref:Expressed protein n=2 Tax=Oryza sativa subsp. japonica TaxID=39947 RepID=Q94GX0_ORYSJ|nr:hypothetical protein [Oryza sativa Japonica Group]ABG66181.1 expressed protein [Oryza sativa Japonica Group]
MEMMEGSGAEATGEAGEVEVDLGVVVGGGVEVEEVGGGGAVEVLDDEVLDVDEAVDAAGDGDGAPLREAVLALGLLEQRPEERVLERKKRLMGLKGEGPGVGAGDGEAEDGEGGVAEGGVGCAPVSSSRSGLFLRSVSRRFGWITEMKDILVVVTYEVNYDGLKRKRAIGLAG